MSILHPVIALEVVRPSFQPDIRARYAAPYLEVYRLFIGQSEAARWQLMPIKHGVTVDIGAAACPAGRDSRVSCRRAVE